MKKEEDEFMSAQAAKIKQLIAQQDVELSEAKKFRNELKEAYLSEARLRIYKHNMQSRFEKRDFSRVFKAVSKYATKFLFMQTNDKVLYDYKRKLKKDI
jgi:hypothetical protein